MKKVQGRGIYLSIHDGSAYRPVACLTSNGLSESQEVKESEPNKCEDTTTFSYGKYSYELSAEGQFLDKATSETANNASYEWLTEFMKTMRDLGENLTWRETIKAAPTATATYRYGKGIITSLELTAPADGDATFSMSIQGVGEITKTDPKAGV